MVVSIVVMVAVWAVVIGFRNQLRARWWAYRLVRAEQVEERTEYLRLLVSLGPTAVPVAEGLLGQTDPSMRSLAMPILHHAECDRAHRLLVDATNDHDEVIRQQAVLGLRGYGDVPTLSRIARREDPAAACAAVIGLASLASPQAIDVLIDLVPPKANHDGLAVRVQAIQSLGQLEVARAAAALRACLDEQTVFEGMTAAEQSAAVALRMLHPDQDVAEPEPRTVAAFAAQALRSIAGPEEAGSDEESASGTHPTTGG